MSLNYSSALTPYADKGQVGAEEVEDSSAELAEKEEELVRLISTAKCLIAITGAGISTSAGIADFRGPKGVWTMDAAGAESSSVDFTTAKPTFTHYALVALERAGMLRWLISQNVDGLHLRSGFPLDRLAELHGNVMAESCAKCGRVFYRPFMIPSVGHKETGRACEGGARPCRGQLRDVTLDWDGALPEPAFSTSRRFANCADVVLCLGTSLQIVPVGDLPLSVRRRGGAIVTVNLQPTKHEKKAALAIHAKVDEVMARLLSRLSLSIHGLNPLPPDQPLFHSSLPPFNFPQAQRRKRRSTSKKAHVLPSAEQPPSQKVRTSR